jgi:hypothetical protein
MMYRYLLSTIVGALGLTVATTNPAMADDVAYNCVPHEVAVYDNYAYVECAKPAPKCRGDYPTDTDGNKIKFFGVSGSVDPDWMNRIIQITNIAITSGMPITFIYRSQDYSGEPLCSQKDCRTPLSATLETTAIIPNLATALGKCLPGCICS